MEYKRGKENVVVDALSRKYGGAALMAISSPIYLGERMVERQGNISTNSKIVKWRGCGCELLLERNIEEEKHGVFDKSFSSQKPDFSGAS